jgi:hypothetical protein
MKKLLIAAGLIVGTLSVAGPAYAIHDPNVPAGVCANSTAAVGIPSITAGNVSQHRSLVFSNAVLDEHNNAVPHCAP